MTNKLQIVQGSYTLEVVVIEVWGKDMFYTDGYRPKNSSGILEGDNLVHLKPQLETMIESGFGFISFQLAVKQAFLLSFVSRMQKSLNRRLAILDIGGGMDRCASIVQSMVR